MKGLIWPLFASVVVGVIATFANTFAPEQKPLDNFGSIPHFILTDSNNQSFDSSSLSGKVWVMNFFFSSCPNTCPTINGRMAALYKQYSHSSDVNLVSVSVDPERDTPQKLTEYLAQYKADATRWHFLTGKSLDIKRLMVEGLHLGTEDDVTLHSTRVLLIDKSGSIRGFYQGMEADSMRQLEQDLKRLR